MNPATSIYHSFPVFHTKTERWTRTEHIASVAMLIPGVYLSVRLKQARRERTTVKREKNQKPEKRNFAKMKNSHTQDFQINNFQRP